MQERRLKRWLATGLVLGLGLAPAAAGAQDPKPASPAVAAPAAQAAPSTLATPLPSGQLPPASTTEPSPAPAIPAPPRSAYISNADSDVLQELIGDARRGDVNGARDALSRISDPSARRLGQWILLDTNGPSLGFAEVDRSLREMADWPRPARRRLAAERLIGTSGLSPRQVIAWFGRETPTTPEGAMALASAYRAAGDPKAAADLIRRTWRGRPFDIDAQKTMMARFGDVLTVDDHVRRADMLLFGAQGPAARDLIPLLPADQQALAQARIAFRQKSPAALALAEALPPSVADAPGSTSWRGPNWRGSRARSGPRKWARGSGTSGTS